MATTVVSGVQYSGSWSLSSVANAVALGTWPTPPAPHLLSWGKNNQGQLGLGNTTEYSSPKQVGSLTTWSSVSTSGGSLFSLALKTDGTLWAWGQNNFGQLGQGNITRYSSPKQIGSLTNWLYISAGYASSFAIKTDGTLWSWGRNPFGALGLGNTTYYSSPKQVGSLTTWSWVGGGYYNTAAIKTDGTLWMWGYNGYGTIGLGNRTTYSSPKQVGSLTNWSKVIVGYYSTLATRTDGTLWSWGQNDQGQLGLGNTTYYSSPKQVGSLTNWLTIASSNNSPGYCLATKTDGTLWTWGSSSYGQLGLGNTTSYSSPKQVGSLTSWLIVTAGYLGSHSIKTDGTLWSWGYNNNNGALGLGNTTSYSSPKQVGSLTSWITIAGGYRGALAIAKT